MWIYNQSNGVLSHGGKEIGTGYSGLGAGKNNTAMERVVNMGPVPRGSYHIGEAFDSEEFGPVVIHLTACTGTDTHGRGGFLVHGDSAEHPGAASHGCIVLPRPVRLAISRSTDCDLAVI